MKFNNKDKSKGSEKPINMCEEPEFTEAFTSLQNMKSRVKESEENIQIYITQLDGIFDQSEPTKQEAIKKEKERLSESMKEIQIDLDHLDNIEKALLNACPSMKQKRKK